MEVTEPTFNRPIPGEGLTHELGARPWQNPPQFSTVDETVSYYLARIGQDEFAKGLINVIEMGVPLTVLANTIQLSGVMEGKHSVDVGILIMPALIEAMSLIADSAGVEYDTGMKEESMLPDQLAQRVAADMSAQDEAPAMEEPMQEEMPVMQEPQPEGGLMSRRV
jgi:hypothetical protein